LQYIENRLAGLAGNKFLAKMFQQFLEMKPLQLLYHKNNLSTSKRFKLGKTRTRHNQLSSISWKFYYGATKLLQADNYVVIINN